MKKQTNQSVTFSICIAASIIFLALRLSGAWEVPWMLIILPIVLYGLLCLGVYLIGFFVGFIFSIPEYTCSKRAYPRCDTPPMYWDPITKQFYMNGELIDNTAAVLDDNDIRY